MKISNKSFEVVEQSKYLGKLLTNQISMQEEIQSTLKPVYACYHSPQILLSWVLHFVIQKHKDGIHGTVILPVGLYGCENWSVKLREEQRLRVFENRVLRKVLGSRKDEVTEEWRRLHNEELYDLYCSPNIIRVVKCRRMRWAKHVARMEDSKDVYSVFVG